MITEVLGRGEETGVDRPVLRLLRPMLLGVLAQASAVALMALSGWLLSRAAQHPPVLYLMTAIVGVRALGLGRGVFRYRERLAGHDVALRLQSALRVRAYRRLAGGTPPRRTGDLVSRVMSDIDAVQDLVVRVLVPVVSTGVLIAAAAAVIGVIEPMAGVLLLGGSVVSGALLPWLATRLAARAADRSAPLRGRLADEIAEIGRARADLTAYGAEGAVLHRLAAADLALRRAEQRTAVAAGATSGLQWLVTGAVVIGSLLAGGRAVLSGDLDPVYLAVLGLTPLALHEALTGLPTAALGWRRTRTSLLRVQPLIASGDADGAGAASAPDHRRRDRSAAIGRRPAGSVALRADRLAVGWSDGPVLLTDLDLSVRAGERVALVGPSGIGKSTVAATIMGFVPARNGSLAITDRIGYLAQDAHIFDTTVGENVRIGGPEADDVQVRAALRSVGLDLPLDRLVGEYGRAVSGGEARRLALGRLALDRMLHGRHGLLLLDEPTEQLDRGTADQILDLVFGMQDDSGVLVITHDPRLMARCDRIVDLSRTAGGQSRTVSTIGSPSVITTVCSAWAPREPSTLRKVQPSGSV